MEDSREGTEEQVQFGFSEIVWAKIIGYPWWPARVTQLPSIRVPNYRVDFFHDHSHAFLPLNKLVKYEDMRCHFDLHRHMNKGLRKAIGEADRLFSQEGTPCVPPKMSPAVVEEHFFCQKQLLKSPQALTHLQENNNPNTLQQSLSQPQSEDSEGEQFPEQQFSPSPKYSREERQKYVSTLLKKYRLLNIPKTADNFPPRNYSKPVVTSHKRRTVSNRKTNKKTKMINKMPSQPTFFYLLARKVYSLLKCKQALNPQQRKDISTSLAKEVLGGGAQEVLGLLKWIDMSPSCTIASFYQNWGCLQGQKQKPSNMTTQQ